MSHLPGSWGGFGNQAVRYRPPPRSAGVTSETSAVAASSSPEPVTQMCIPDKQIANRMRVQQHHSGVSRRRRPSTTGSDSASRQTLATKLALATAGADSVLEALTGNSEGNNMSSLSLGHSFSSSLPLLSLPTVCIVVGSSARYVRGA